MTATRATAVLLFATLSLACGGVALPEVDVPGAGGSGGGGKSTVKVTKSPNAGKGQIQVTTMAGVQLLVDGNPIPFDMNQGSYIADVKAGTHQIELVNLLMKTVASESVNVPAGKRVRFRYQKKELSRIGTVEATFNAAPAAPPAAPAPAAVSWTGSVQVSGITAPYGAVWIDGRSVAAGPGGFAMSGLPAGVHELRVENQGIVVYQGPVDVMANRNRRCLTTSDGWTWVLDCHWTEGSL